jgi:hypothetical protein
MNAIVAEVLTFDSALACVHQLAEQLRAAEADHQADVAALERGRERLAAAEAEIARIGALNADAVARHAERLERQTREGVDSAPAALVPSERHLLQEVTAQRTKLATEKMVESLEGSVQAKEAKLASNRRAYDAALQQLHSVEVTQLQADCFELLERFEALFSSILARSADFGDDLRDRDAEHARLRAVYHSWQYGGGRDMRVPPHLLGENAPAFKLARDRLAERDHELTHPDRSITGENS